MKSNLSLCLVVALLVFTSNIAAQKNSDKPYSQWSKDDSIKLITDSPWAKTYQSTRGSATAAEQQIGREQGQSANRGGNNPGSVGLNFGPAPVAIRLFSAMPVRQALVRLQQIEAGYDKMKEADRKDFDAGRAKFLECAICKDYYVITLVKFPDSSGQYIEEGIFQGMTMADLKGNVKLVNDQGQERELVQFNAPKDARDVAVFYFKRTEATGTPLLSAQSKTLIFMFKNEFLDSANRFAYLVPRTFEFKVSKFTANDKVEF